MMGIGSGVDMGNIGNNNMVGLRGLGNVMGLGGGARGMSAPVGPISGIGNNGQQNTMTTGIGNALSQQLRTALTPAAQALMVSKFRIQNRTNMLGAPQSSVISGVNSRQFHPTSAGLSMLGQNINRPHMSPMQRVAMGPVVPSKLSGLNYMNHQQLQLQQHLQQQQLQQQQLQQQQQQQQEMTTSPLQAVVSPQHVGSPSTMGLPQQMSTQQTQQPQQQQASPQQMGQRTPMSPAQVSSGAIHPVNGANPEACPASPQLGSQTLGSVGSIANSPMELQGVNTNNSVSNA